MSSNPPVKLKWLEHLHTAWVSEGSEALASRDGVATLYSRLLSNQEVVAMPQQVLHLKGPLLPDFDREPLSADEQEHYLNSLLSSQLTLARTVCSDSPFSSTLQKRLVVLHRIFHAISTKYHDRDKSRQVQVAEDGGLGSEENQAAGERARTGTEALIEMGVRTGLSLIFSLLRQTWAGNQSPVGGLNLCNDVLQTALDVICSLPPLSLANESKLPALGLSTLSEVTKFLKSITMPLSGADMLGRRLASELVLAIAAQRGSLRYLLEWIEMALCASSASRPESTMLEAEGKQIDEKNQVEENCEQSRVITHCTFYEIIRQMKHSAVSKQFNKRKSCLELAHFIILQRLDHCMNAF